MTPVPRLDIRKIRIIFQREFRDQLRDRRTLFMVMAFPILLYPALGIGMLQMAVIFSEKPRTVVVLGADSLPKPARFTISTNNARGCSRLQTPRLANPPTSPRSHCNRSTPRSTPRSTMRTSLYLL